MDSHIVLHGDGHDGHVVLHWLQGNGSCKQFAHNRVKYINSKTPVTWRPAKTILNSADIRSRVSNIENLPKEWWDRPGWLNYPDDWPEQKDITPTRKSEKETEIIKDFM